MLVGHFVFETFISGWVQIIANGPVVKGVNIGGAGRRFES